MLVSACTHTVKCKGGARGGDSPTLGVFVRCLCVPSYPAPNPEHMVLRVVVCICLCKIVCVSGGGGDLIEKQTNANQR